MEQSTFNGDGRGKNSLQTLEHAFTILEAMGNAGREMGVMELSRLLGMPKSTVHRVLSTLRDHRFIEQNATSGKYRLGLRLWELGCGYMAQLELNRIVRPYLEWLTLHSGESSHLAVFDRGEVVYLHILESDRPMRSFVRIGGRTPSHCTAAGKALLAYQEPQVVEEILTRGLTAYSVHTITEPDRFLRELSNIRGRGFALSNGEYLVDVASIAAPIWDHSGLVVAAIGVSGPAVGINIDRLTDLVSQAAVKASAALGYPPLRASPWPSTTRLAEELRKR